MKRIFIFAIFLLNSFCILYVQDINIPNKYDNIIVHTKIKNQYNTSNCWLYSSISFIESECIKKDVANKNLDLSEIFILYYTYLERAQNCLDKNDINKFRQKGFFLDAIDTIEKYGIVREEDYIVKKQVVNTELYNKVRDYLEESLERNILSKNKKNNVLLKVKNILDDYLSPPPSEIIINSKKISANDYAKKILKIKKNDFIIIESDNSIKEKIETVTYNNQINCFYNIPLKDFCNITKYLLKNNYSIDGSFYTCSPIYSKVNGYAINQKSFTDDEIISKRENRNSNHEMHIVGLTKYDNKFWFLVKNSFGDSNIGNKMFPGYLNTKEDFFELNAIYLVVNKKIIKKKFSNIINTEINKIKILEKQNKSLKSKRIIKYREKIIMNE